jgi:hypothetical protein
MEATAGPTLREILIIFGICAAGSLAGAIALLIVAARQIANINIPEGADFFETLQHVPITVPLALDLLDMSFDIFSAPISWVILELLGLQSLQLITVFEGLVPGTQLIPTMTGAWIISRLMRKKPTSEARLALDQYQIAQRRSRYGNLRGGASADYYRRKALPGPDPDIVDGEYFEEDLDEPDPGYFYEEEIDQ